MLTDVSHITEENFKDVDPRLLIEPKWYGDVEHIVGSVAAASTADYAKEYAVMLASKLTAVGDALPKNLQARYLSLLKILKFVSLRTLEDKPAEAFFHEEVLDCFKTDLVDAKETVEQIFKGYADAPEIIEENRRLFLRGFEKNQETIGSNNITVTISGEDKLVRPTVANWLNDYNTSVHINPELKKRGGYEQVNYLTASKNARTLNKEDRDLLIKIIKFYDWLKFDPLKYDFRLPGEPARAEEYVNADKPQPLIPEDLIQSIEKFREAKQLPQLNVPSSYIQAKKFELPEEVLRPQGNVMPLRVPPTVPMPKVQPARPVPPSTLPIRPPQTLNATPPTSAKIISPAKSSSEPFFGASSSQTFNRVNFQDILKEREQGQSGVAGLRIGEGGGSSQISNNQFPISSKGKTGDKNPSSYILNPLLEKKPAVQNKATPPGPLFRKEGGQDKAQEIDRKLEELKNKLNKTK